ncbi:MAG: FAD-binding protein [Dehalococcoidia bacterium]
MKLRPAETLSADVLIIGSGGAGLRAAIEARRQGADVLLVSKSRAGYGNNTAIARGGFAALGLGAAEDSPEVHFRDTLASGRFLNDQRLAGVMTEGCGQQVRDLQQFGVKLVRKDGGIRLNQLPGHSYARSVNCVEGLGTGLTLPLRRQALSMGVRVVEGVLITRLLRAGNTAVGAMGLDRGGGLFVFSARATVLAAAGLGQVYLRTNNAAGATGDGYALAYQAGLPLADMEFIQFYPTSPGEFKGTGLIVYETLVAREGGVVRNSLGENILPKHGIENPMVMTRDRLARAIMTEILEGRSLEGSLVLDLSHLDEGRFERLRPILPRGSPPGKRRFLVAPTTHFAMGGVMIDEKAQTRLEGLYAAGEVCGGVHGANRLASNSLTEVFVFGTVAGGNAARRAAKMERPPLDGQEISAERERIESLASSQGGEGVEELRRELRSTMWLRAGIIRDGPGLRDALGDIGRLQERYRAVSVSGPGELLRAIELGGMLTVSEMICRAALERTESRGSHYRADYPRENNEQWLKNIVISCRDGEMTLSQVPVDLVRAAP